MTLRHLLCTAFACCALASLAAPAAAQQYPTREIRLIVPLTAGGPGDTVSRVVAKRMADVLGQPVVVENMAGADMNIGAEYVSRAKPDGYTLLMSATPLVVNPSLYRQMKFDPIQDFTPISVIASLPLVLIANKSLPFKTVEELVAYAKARPGALNYGSAGNGSLTHLAGELFASMSGTQLSHIPYRGINEAVIDLIGGRVQLAFAGAPIALSHANQGTVRAIANTGSNRFEEAPDVPTVAESGLAGFDVTPWYGIVAPAGTPEPIIQRWHNELVKIMQSPAIKQQWLSLGADATPSASPEAFGKLMRADAEKWSKVVKDSNVPVN